MSEPRAQLEAALAGRYTILSELGAGANATVYLAHDVKHDRSVAVKVLRPGLAATLGSERFLQEIRVTAGLNHPHITPLYDSGEAAGHLYYVMPAIEGESLRDKLERERQLGLDEALALTRELADALDYAHEHNIVHRDIKPENILIHRGKAQIADFGISGAIERAGGERLTATGMSVGTPAYMSPEQAAGDRTIGPRSDVYSLAAVLYEMLAGDPPFTGANVQAVVTKVMVETPRRLAEVRPGVATQVDDAIARALLKVPGDRFATAREFSNALSVDTDAAGRNVAIAIPQSAPRRRLLVGASIVVLGAVGAWFTFGRKESPTVWVRDYAIPEIERLVRDGQFDSAWAISTEAAARAPGDPAVGKLLPGFTRTASSRSEPTGARVFRKAYNAGENGWLLLGTTPLDSVRFPRGVGVFRVELEGYRTVFAMNTRDVFTLDRADPKTDGMVRVPGWDQDVDGVPMPMMDFFIDKYEVTNADFKRFVEAGGYREPRYWQHPFVLDGRSVSWTDAMARFSDQTGRPGPSTWQVGTFPDGQDDFPVGGVSWYEAAAYADFADKSLPTRDHWIRAHHASGLDFMAYIVPASNLGRSGPDKVGQHAGIGPFGTFDMAGNVREWALNEIGDRRVILGGGWNDPDYMALTRDYAQPAFDRAPTNGFRLASYTNGDPGLPRAMERLTVRAPTDFRATAPVSPEILTVYRRAFDYDSIPLDARIEASDSGRHWVRQKVSFNAAYGDDRVTLYLYLPLKAPRPLQTLVYWPGSGAVSFTAFEQWAVTHIDFIVQSGRAVAFPVLDGTFERGDEFKATAYDAPENVIKSNRYRDRVLHWVKDVKRTVDYLQSRADIDATRFAYFGYSWGGNMASIALANEPRIKAAVLYVTGFNVRRAQPEVDDLTYIREVRVPVLMLSGRLDAAYLLETSARPYFELLGTPAANKRHVVSEGAHFVPRPQLIRETLDWLDRYVGRVAHQ